MGISLVVPTIYAMIHDSVSEDTVHLPLPLSDQELAPVPVNDPVWLKQHNELVWDDLAAGKFDGLLNDFSSENNLGRHDYPRRSKPRRRVHHSRKPTPARNNSPSTNSAASPSRSETSANKISNSYGNTPVS